MRSYNKYLRDNYNTIPNQIATNSAICIGKTVINELFQ